MAVSGCFGTAKRKVNLCSDCGSIDVKDPRHHLLHCTKRPVHVACVYGSGKSVTHSVDNLNGMIQVATLDNGNNRPKNLLLGDSHFGFHVGKNGRLDKVAMLEVTLFTSTAAAQQLCSIFTLSNGDVSQ